MRLKTSDLSGLDVRSEVHVLPNDDAVILSVVFDLGRTTRMRRQDASDMLRAMLREIEGPSLADVRRAYGVDGVLSGHGEMRRVGGMWRVYLSCTLYFEGETQADALMAAWDARPEWSRPDRHVETVGAGGA